MKMLGLSFFLGGFKSSKCKTTAKMATARIKLLRNKRQVVVRQMRRDIALLLQSRQDATARIRVEHVIREQNFLAANEIIELFCGLVVARCSIISKQRECPADLKEGISSLIFAAPRCSDIPELLEIRRLFEKKYGKDFVSAATELRPSCGVNRVLIEKLSVKNPTGEVKLNVMKDIAKEYQIDWDTSETEMELLKPPEKPIDGPNTFVSAASMPVKPPAKMQTTEPPLKSSGGAEAVQFDNATTAAEAAAESARKAIHAAQAAAFLANINPGQHATRAPSFDNNSNHRFSHPPPTARMNQNAPQRTFESHQVDNDIVMQGTGVVDGGKMHRRHSYNVTPRANSDIKFDESGSDEEFEREEYLSGFNPSPPQQAPPALPKSHDLATDDMGSHKQNTSPGIHPRLPDYDSLAARFEALKHHRNSLP